jgi:hypothetical protein
MIKRSEKDCLLKASDISSPYTRRRFKPHRSKNFKNSIVEIVLPLPTQRGDFFLSLLRFFEN